MSAVVLISVGGLLVLAAAGWTINATVFTARTHRVGAALIRQEAARIGSPGTRSGSGCSTLSSAAPVGGPAGILRAPAIGLVAPVEQGVSDPVLAVAVGHVPTSVWPGQRGTAVLSAHDVSYFVDAAQLAKGALIRYDTPCASYTFAVDGHQVVKAGTAVYNTAVPSLTLVTCWPTDALWFTPDRLLVTATEVQAVPRKTAAHAAVPTVGTEAPPAVAVPPALAAQGLTLATNSVPMGTMTISTSAAPGWVSSPGPLDVEASALEAFIGGIKALNQDHPAWFHSLAPGVPVPQGLVRAPPPRYLSPLEVRIAASGDTAQSVVLSTAVDIPGGSAPGRYAMTVTTSVVASHLSVTGWSMARQ